MYARVLASTGKNLKGSVFLEAIAEREEANRSGKMMVSLKIMHKTMKVIAM